MGRLDPLTVGQPILLTYSGTLWLSLEILLSNISLTPFMDHVETKTSIINESTLVPLSFLIVIVGLIAPVIILFYQVSEHSTKLTENKEAISEVKLDVKAVKDDYKNQIDQLTGKFNDMTILLTKIATKLNVDVKPNDNLQGKILPSKNLTFDE